jgi:ferredoxin
MTSSILSGFLSRLNRWFKGVTVFNQVAQPTYERDRVGAVQQWDEREILFARKDLFRCFGVDSPQYQAYYAAHPEHLAYDTKVGTLPELGKRGGIDVPMFEAQFEVVRALGAERFVDGPPASEAVEIAPQRAAAKVKALARLLGADLVKIGPLRQAWVYSHVGRSYGDREGFQKWGRPVDLQHHAHAIAMGFAMDYGLIRSAPDFPVLLATAKGYATGAWVAVQLAQYLRMLGYSARAHHLYNYRVICVPVAVDCGLGELSRAGYLITRELGLGVRLAIVTTDMPLAHDAPVDLGVQSFCAHCKICAEHCPVGAIPPGDKVAFNGIKKWKLDAEKCYRYWHAVGSDCSLCMTSCPWTKPQNWLHRFLSWPATIKGPHQALMTEAHKLFYGAFKGAPRPDFIDPYER